MRKVRQRQQQRVALCFDRGKLRFELFDFCATRLVLGKDRARVLARLFCARHGFTGGVLIALETFSLRQYATTTRLKLRKPRQVA